MKKYRFHKYLLIFAISILVIACGSVRNRTGSKNAKSDTKTTNLKNPGRKNFQAQKPNVPKDRFSDTTVIYLTEESQYIASNDSPVRSQYEQGIKLFDSKDFTAACNIFKGIVENYTEKDDIYYDSRFYTAECLILANDVETAEKLFLNTLDAKNVPDFVTEKVLVRLGQVYCLMNKHSLAQRYFTRLKNEFPNSDYLKVASCE